MTEEISHGGLTESEPLLRGDNNHRLRGHVQENGGVDLSSIGDQVEVKAGAGGCLSTFRSAFSGGGTSWVAAMFLIVNCALGGGLLEFPYAYSEAGGVVPAIIVQAILVGFVLVSLLILAYCAEVNKSVSYQEVVLHMCGKKLETVCSVCIVLYCYGTCITFLIIIGDQFGQFFAAVYGPTFCKHWYMSRVFTVPMSSVLVILPLCFSKKIDFLKYPSIIGVGAILYVVALITAKYFIGVDVKRGPIKTSPDSVLDLFIVVPTICFSYQCHIGVVPIYSCLRDRTIKNFSKSVVSAVLICVAAYTGAAAFGYYTFGDGLTLPDILQSYKPTPDVVVAVLMILLKCIVTYPILTYLGRIAIADLWAQARSLPSYEVSMYEPLRRIIITVVWFITSLVLAIFIPNIAVVIDLLGGLAAVFIFVFPGLCLLRLTYKYMDVSARSLILYSILGAAFIVFGTFIFGVVTTQSIMADINPKVTSGDTTVCK